MLKIKNLVKVVSGLVIGLSLAGAGAQVASAKTIVAPLASAEDVPAAASVKKGDKIFVVVKDTKKQTVAVYNKNAKKTKKTVKMGSEFTAKQVKRVHGKKIVKINKTQWLNTKDVVKD